MTEKERRLAERNGILDKLYGQEVNRLIRERYTVSDELAILRQRDEKPAEFNEYNLYVEDCKRRAKEGIYGNSAVTI
jgi:hypothetical protein